MFGMFTEMFSKPKSNTPDSTIKPIMVADYLGTTSTDDRMLMEERAGSKKVITNDLIGLFNDYSNSRNRKFLDGIIGKNDGSFPITNPVKDKIYYYPVDKKYYKCKKSVSGAVNAPDATNFTEFSLFNFKGGVTGITMTGAATGTGSLNEVTGMMTVNTTVNYANITGKPSTMPNPHALTIKLNGSSGTTYSGTSAAEINITPASIGAQVAGSYALSSHNHDTVYSKTTHNHDDRYYTETEVNNKLAGYQPKGDYAASGHTHPYLPTDGGTITGNLTVNGTTYVAKDRGIKFHNTEGQERWMIHNNDGTEIGIGYSGADALPVRVYGSLLVNTDKAVWHSGNFDPSTKASTSHNHDSVYSKLDHNHNSAYAAKAHDHAGVYQPVGSYALSSHNHDSAYAAKTHNHSGVYAPISHTHTSADISALTGYAKAASASAIAVTDTLNVALGKLEKALDGKAPTGNYSVVGHNHNDAYNTKSEITNLLAGKLGATANAVSASKLATARTISVSGAVSGSNTFDGSGNMNISTTLNSLDASKITSGTISVDRLPKTALSEFIPVANKAARLALTKTQAQNGDTVKETDTKRMYLVIDNTKLSTEEGYQEYTTVVDWSVITGKPSTFQPISHTHTWAQISDRPSTMANPHALTISLNGKAQTAYTGSAAVSFNITPASIGAQVAGSYAAATHNHSGVYAPVSHSHTIGQIGALAGYTKAGSVSAITTSDTILSAFGKLEKALDGKQAAGSYASSSHNHDSVYSKLGHAHAWGEITGKPSTFTPSTHNQASSTITAMTGYSKPSSTSAIGTGDSLNTAIGKLEKALDGKQASGSYAAANHNHNGVYAPASHNHTLANISTGEYCTAGSVHPINAPLISSMRGNRTFGLNPSDITIEYSKDGGATWLDYGASDDKKSSLFNEIRGGDVGLGKATNTELNVAQGTKSRLRITIKATNSSRYCGIDKTYIWFLSNGNTTRCSCSTASFAEKNTWVPVWTDKPLSGWSGPNFFNHRMIMFQGPSGTSDTNCYAIRYEFWMTQISTQYPAAQVLKINTYGPTAWETGNAPFVGNDHLYTWDNKFNMILPAGLEAKGEIKGVVTKAKQDEQGNVIHTTYSKTTHSHDWTAITSRPSTMPNPNGLTISLNGKAQTTYTGASAVAFNITPASIGAQVAGSYAASSHNHDTAYAAKSHNHDGVYAPASHSHSYLPLSGGTLTGDVVTKNNGGLKYLDSSGTAKWLIGNGSGNYIHLGYSSSGNNVPVYTYNEIYANGNQKVWHAGNLNPANYQPKGSYASSSHNHNGVYAPVSHTHLWAHITDKPSTFTPSAHNQASSTITSMSGYTKASSVAAISTSDSLNVAIGKLEKALDGKQAAGSYAAASHNHSGVYQPAGSYAAASHTHDDRYFTETEINDKLAGYQPKGSYAAASHGNHVPATQTANNKIFLRCDNTWHTITPAEIGAQPAGSYAAASHNHSGVYAPASHTHAYLPTSGGTISGALTVTGQILSNADVVAYSDVRMKTNITKIKSALDKVSAINGYTYDMQGVDHDKRQAGVIAQELKKVLPEAVITDANGYYAVRYTNIIPLLIEALKEEKSKRESLEERLAKIERMLDIK